MTTRNHAGKALAIQSPKSELDLIIPTNYRIWIAIIIISNMNIISIFFPRFWKAVTITAV